MTSLFPSFIDAFNSSFVAPFKPADTTPDIDFSSYVDNADSFFRISPQASSNTTETIDTTFTPANVNTSLNSLVISGITFDAPTTAISIAAVPVYFSSTGTLPSPLVAGTRYYLRPNATSGFDVYPEQRAGDWVNIPNATQDETPLPAQNLLQQTNKITFSSQGTGTHRVYTDTLSVVMPDLTGSGAYEIRTDASDRHKRWIIKTDNNGKKYIESRLLCRDPGDDGSYNIYGFASDIGPSGERINFQTNLRSKRTCVLRAVLKNKATDTRGLAKCPVAPTNVNTSTGVITKGAGAGGHTFTTGWKIKLLVHPTGTLPTGFSGSTTYFVRSVSSTTFTLHPTSTDATNNTNVVIPSTQGTVGFTAVAFERPADVERMRFIAEVRRPDNGANTITVRQNGANWGSTILTNATDYLTNGRIGATGRTVVPLTPTNTDIHYVYVWFPTETTAPTRTDTGTALTSGYYWMTREPSSGVYTRLHTSLANAQASVGIIANSLSSTQCIKYSAAGVGFSQIESAQGQPVSIAAETGTELAVPNFWSIPYNELGLLEVFVDYNNPGATGILEKVYWNGTLVGTMDRHTRVRQC